MLLPEMPSGAEMVVAREGTQQLVIGAASAAPAWRTPPHAGPGVIVHVIEPCRQRGVGRALLGGILRLVIAQGAQFVYAAQRVAFGGAEMQAWQRFGFDVCETVEEHELPLDLFVPRLAPLLERMHRRGSIPEDARIIPLYSANRADVLQFHLDHLGGNPEALALKLRGEGSGAFHPRYSQVLMSGNRVVGCILCHLKSRTVAAVDANIVAPDVRGGWANVWLKLEATQLALALGITHFHFTSFDHYADTRSFTEKLGGVTTRRWALMRRPLGISSDAAITDARME
jgi:hypothetical protein